VQGTAGVLITSLLQVYLRKTSKSQLTFDRVMAMSLWPHYFGPPQERPQDFV